MRPLIVMQTMLYMWCMNNIYHFLVFVVICVCLTLMECGVVFREMIAFVENCLVSSRYFRFNLNVPKLQTLSTPANVVRAM